MNLHRATAERHARAVLADAEARGATGREKRRMLRARFATLNLPDARQGELIDRGPARRRARKKKAVQ